MFETVDIIKNTMSKFGFPWFIAGGWAIDLFLNTETRTHDDIEIGIFRNNQMQLFRYFEKCKKYYVDNRNHTGKRDKHEWKKEYLRFPIHELYVELTGLEIEVLLNESDEGNWIYRRDSKIALEMGKAILFTDSEIPYLCPEIVSLYKSKEMRAKDVADISKALVKMRDFQTKWLISSIKDEAIKERIRSLANA